MYNTGTGSKLTYSIGVGPQTFCEEFVCMFGKPGESKLEASRLLCFSLPVNLFHLAHKLVQVLCKETTV